MGRKKLSFLLSILFSLAFPIYALAGGINSEEAGIVAVVEGGFEYEGVNYQAAPGYLAEVKTYLSQDTIDLTAEQAKEAKANLYANIPEAVKEGYIIPSSGTAKEKEGSEKKTEASPEKKMVHTGTGSTQVLDETGKTVFEAEGIIKDTGYHTQGSSIMAVVFVCSLAGCMLYIKKMHLFI